MPLSVRTGKRIGRIDLSTTSISQLRRGVDLVHVHSCDIPDVVAWVLAPGGLVLVEGLRCTEEEEFGRFIEKAKGIGAVAVGRQIAVVVKRGEYEPDTGRLRDAVRLVQQMGTRGELDDNDDDGEDDEL